MIKDINSNKTELKKNQVEHVARLANIHATEKQLKVYTEQFKKIIEYIQILNEVDTSNVHPTFQVIDEASNIFRKDQIKPSLGQQEALSQATKTYKGYFVTEGVFDDR